MYLSFYSQLLVVVRRHRLQFSCVKYKSYVQVKHRYVNRTCNTWDSLGPCRNTSYTIMNIIDMKAAIICFGIANPYAVVISCSHYSNS